MHYKQERMSSLGIQCYASAHNRRKGNEKNGNVNKLDFYKIWKIEPTLQCTNMLCYAAHAPYWSLPYYTMSILHRVPMLRKFNLNFQTSKLNMSAPMPQSWEIARARRSVSAGHHVNKGWGQSAVGPNQPQKYQIRVGPLRSFPHWNLNKNPMASSSHFPNSFGIHLVLEEKRR